jgi:hypothetical protein
VSLLRGVDQSRGESLQALRARCHGSGDPMTELTPEERERIYQEEKARHEARQSIELRERRNRAETDRRRQQKTALVLLVGSVVFVGVCTVLMKSTPSPPPRSPQKVLEDRTKAEEGVEILRQTGILIRLDAEAKKAYVDKRNVEALS